MKISEYWKQYQAFILPARSMPLGNQMVLEQINEQGRLELEYHYFATPNEIMDLDNGHHWLKTLQKD